MTQNRSSAVMQRRHEAPDSLDDFPTPPWATRALIEHLNTWGDVSRDSVWEPACGRGYMERTLGEAFARVHASDIRDYGADYAVRDFLGQGPLFDETPDRDHALPSPRSGAPSRVQWIITNPPYRLAEDFALRAFELAEEGVALFVRLAFLEGAGRHARLFKPHPPEWILQFTERVVLHKGRLAPDGSSATAYCWVIWLAPYRPSRGLDHPAFVWIPPCRKRLERPEDYR